MITKKEFLKYYNQGFSDTKIGDITKTCRHKIGKFRKKLNLPRMSYVIYYKEKITNLVNKGYSDISIAKKLNISKSMVGYIRSKHNIKTNFIERNYDNPTNRRKGYMIRNVKYSATRKGLHFDLEYTDLELPKYCPILNIALNYTSNYQNFDHATVDRIDNSKGYIKGNIIVISRLANAMKNQANFDQLDLFCKNILKLKNYYKNRGALGSITDIFPDTEFYKET